ncbi:MAG: sugar ABC transporter substrate-binding protein [Propionibacteriaceae bacterium]|jgi:multiple sugar transport system substrate-binding protein|nr:sugar ABC transporter substrate-binding protein [Propionibacteriaceae bacterium]
MKKPSPTTALTCALALSAALALTACSGPGPATNATPDGPATISILDWFSGDIDHEATQKVFDRCADAAGVKLDRQSIDGANLVQRVLQQASTKTLPDILMIDHTDVPQIAAMGALRPLTDADISSEGYADGVVSSGMYQNKLYGLIPNTATLSLFVNNALLKEAGVTAPKTWDELKSTAAALTHDGQYGLGFSAVADFQATWQFLPFFWTNGADETDITSPEAVEALQLLTDLLKAGSVSNSVLNWTSGDVREQFVAGKAAMIVDGPWDIPVVKSEAPDLDWSIVLIPTKNASDTSVAPLGGEAWTLPATSADPAHQAKAGEVLKCFLGDDSQISMGVARATIPGKTTLKDEYLKQMPDMATFAQQVANARSRTAKLGVDWPKTATALYQAEQLALTGQMDPADALKSEAANLG